MPASLPENPEYIIRGVLRENWKKANANDYDPTIDPDTATSAELESWLPIHLGWYDTEGPDPQVTLTNFSEGTAGGGRTTYSGNAGDGSGAVQDRDGSGLITVHAAKGSYNNGKNAERTLYAIRTEIERIIQDQASKVPEFEFIGCQWDGRSPSTETKPVVYQSQVSCVYGWIKTP
jgi:hypothetical protein